MTVRILIVGDSHVGSLRKGIQSLSLGWKNFRLDRIDVVFDFCGLGGARTRQLLPSSYRRDNFFANMIASKCNTFQPHVVWLLIGNNDIEDGQETPQELALRIFNTAHMVKNRNISVQLVSVIQLLPHYPGARGNVPYYNVLAAQVNEHLLHLCVEQAGRGDFSVHYAKAKLFFQIEKPKAYWNSQKYFDAGGVHLNNRGIQNVMKRLKPTVILALRAIN